MKIMVVMGCRQTKENGAGKILRFSQLFSDEGDEIREICIDSDEMLWRSADACLLDSDQPYEDPKTDIYSPSPETARALADSQLHC